MPPLMSYSSSNVQDKHCKLKLIFNRGLNEESNGYGTYDLDQESTHDRVDLDRS